MDMTKLNKLYIFLLVLGTFSLYGCTDSSNEPGITVINYESLTGTCQDKCCLSSIRAMKRSQGLPRKPGDACPAGFGADKLSCPTSRLWCVNPNI